MCQISDRLIDWLKCSCLVFIVLLVWDCVLWSCVGGAIAAIPAYFIAKSYSHNHFPARYTTPLEPYVAEHLCSILSLDVMDDRCQSGEVYAIEFFRDIQRHYRRGVPREEVDGELGVYLVDCGEWESSSDAGWLRRCYYDFKGDGEYVLTILYTRWWSDPDDFEGQVWGYPRW